MAAFSFASELEKNMTASPIFHHSIVDVSEYPIIKDEWLLQFFPTVRKSLKTWGIGESKENDVHWIGVRFQTGLHTDKGCPRYTHHLVLRCDNFCLRGYDKKEVYVRRGSYVVVDTHSPHQLLALDAKAEYLYSLREWIHKELSSTQSQPIDLVRWVPFTRVHANDYNPNSVAKNEMRLLHMSIKHDGYTQPVVTVYDNENDCYVIVDGFHRYTTMRLNADIQDMTGGLLPIVVLDKDINDRMASTVRHNRARGKHSVSGMSNMVFSMLDNGWTDEAICAELGLEAEELIRLKHVTGFSKLFENVEYRQRWEKHQQVKERFAYKNSLKNQTGD